MTNLYLLEVIGMFVYTFAILMQPTRLRPFVSCGVLSIILWYNQRHHENHFNFVVELGSMLEGKVSALRCFLDLICQFVGVILAFFVVRQIQHHSQ